MPRHLKESRASLKWADGWIGWGTALLGRLVVGGPPLVVEFSSLSVKAVENAEDLILSHTQLCQLILGLADWREMSFCCCFYFLVEAIFCNVYAGSQEADADGEFNNKNHEDKQDKR
jgi:hypothetical protein